MTCDLCVLRLTALTLNEHVCPQLPFNPWGEQVFPISSYVCVQRCVDHMNLTRLEYLHRGKWQIFTSWVVVSVLDVRTTAWL